jgi:hypothetical protein
MIYLVEDDDLKARTIERVCKLARPGYEVVRMHVFTEFCNRVCDDISRFGNTKHQPRAFCCITDWNFPRNHGGSPQELGSRVLDILGEAVPAIVVSGADKPIDFERRYPDTRWLNLGQVLELQAWLVKL